MIHSIFSRPRFEYDGSHLYFLDQVRMRQLEGDVPLLITGSRGTGKTTLLNSLNWAEQLNNPYLREKIENPKYVDDYLGVYMKLPKINFSPLSVWEDDNPSLYSILFAFYFDLMWLEQLTMAAAELSSLGQINISGSSEDKVCAAILNKEANIVSQFATSRRIGLADLAAIFKDIRVSLESSAIYKEDATDVHRRFPVTGQVGEFGRSVAAELHQLWAADGSRKYKFKICIDECECLTRSQVKILSTMVRLSSHPAFFVLSFISMPEDFYSTLIPNLSIGKSDIDHLALDEVSDTEFQSFAEGVVNVRLQAENIIEGQPFRNDVVFGRLSINTLIQRVLSKSEKKSAHEFLNRAQTRSAEDQYFSYYDETTPCFYQVYLVEALSIDTKKPEMEDWSKARRHQDSKEIRKKMVSAYLSICHEYGMEPIYASSEMVFQISDKSIRDYLWQLHEVYVESNCDLTTFVQNEAPLDVQDRALKRASENKIRSLPSSPLTAPGKVYCIVNGLGLLTNSIQKKSSDGSHLRSPERGLFVVAKGSTDHEREIVDLIIEAAEAGFLKIAKNDQGAISFRIHTSLSPYFKTSYRGAYYETKIELNHLRLLKDTENYDELPRRVQSISESIYAHSDKQMTIDGF